jgi:quercetin dioxygenase-like cupin family protein
LPDRASGPSQAPGFVTALPLTAPETIEDTMRTFDTGSTDFEQVGPIAVARWEQYQIGDGVMPFGAMWYTVPPGSSSVREHHPEFELSIVVTGTAHVEASGTITEVSPGNAFLLDSDEPHVIHNRTSDQLLTIFSGYWMPLSTEVASNELDPAAQPAPPQLIA